MGRGGRVWNDGSSAEQERPGRGPPAGIVRTLGAPLSWEGVGERQDKGPRTPAAK